MILSVCEVPEVLKVMIIIKLVINIIKISVPIILILVCMIEYMKAVKDTDEMKDVNKKIVNKIIAAVLIFFIPTLVGIIFRVFDPEGNTYPGCLSIASESRVNELYSNNMENYIKEAETKKDNASIKAARSYLSNIKDPDKREEFDSKLVIIEMDKYMEDVSKEKSLASYYVAEKYLSMVKDKEKKEQYYKKLKELKEEIDEILNGEKITYNGISSSEFNAKLKTMKTPTIEQIKKVAKKNNISDSYLIILIGTTQREGYVRDPYLHYGWASAMINVPVTYARMQGWDPYHSGSSNYYSEANIKRGYNNASSDVLKSVYIALTYRNKKIVECNGMYKNTPSSYRRIYKSSIYNCSIYEKK